MQDLLSDKTIKAKEAFEQFAAEHGIKIKHYHCQGLRHLKSPFFRNITRLLKNSTIRVGTCTTTSQTIPGSQLHKMTCARFRIPKTVRELCTKVLLSRQVQVYVGEFTPCHNGWPIQCLSAISTVMHTCTTWHRNLLSVRHQKICITIHDSHLELQEQMRNPIAFHAEMMGDIMYLHQALKQKDASQFVDAVITEINGHVENEHWKLVKRDSVPDNVQIVPSVWSLHHKRNLTTNEITKHKARLNLHGGKQIYGMNYYETYAPVVTWFAIRLMIIFGILFQWSLRQVNFIMAYPPAPIEMDIYMELPPTRHRNC